MNQLSARNRKLVYMVGIILLLIPIVVLGMPATERTPPNEAGQSGGKIARLRHNYKLGETTLGDVDPASATMNLVLLGMRGVAASMQWMQADKQKEMKNWSELEQTVESIIKLQPRFLQVWKYQGWNLAFNVSAECDAVEDRFFWVKKGAKFLTRGIRQNEDQAELYHDTGTFLGKKIGRSDEHETFRRFFKNDPDPRWEGRADEDINPDGLDNYLVSREYYEIANQKEEMPGIEQHIMARSLFRSYPGRSQFDYAQALENDGTFDEVTVEAWRNGHDWWTTTYGRERFSTPGGEVMLGATPEDLEQLAAEDENFTVEDKKHWLDRYQKMTNFPYWKNRSEIESQRTTVDARRKLYEGKAALLQRMDLVTARRLLEEGLNELEGILEKYPDLLYHEETLEDIIKSQLMWQYVLRLYNEPIPDNFPLRDIWDANPEMRAELDDRFQRVTGAGMRVDSGNAGE